MQEATGKKSNGADQRNDINAHKCTNAHRQKIVGVSVKRWVD